MASLTAAAVLLILILTGRVDDGGYSGPGTTTAFGPSVFTQLPTATPPPPEPTPTPPSDAPVTRLAIPRFEVDAPVVVRGVDAAGEMQTPDGPTDVAWYDFSAHPGFGSNAVFSAHVDYINYGPAVFWHLKDLEPADLIEVRLEDGTVYRYGVVSKEQIDAATADIGKIVGRTPKEVITLITCGGEWDAPNHQYLQRVVVRAEPIVDTAATPGPGAAFAP